MTEMKRLRRWACVLSVGVVLLTALSFAAGWRARTTQRWLEEVDAEMDRDPRRALSMLDSLDRDRLCGIAQQAKFALLYTQAQDKNYIDETNDSLIRVASGYFESHGEVRDRFRALYYRGRIQINRGEFSRAMISFMEAERLVRELKDDYLAGLLYAQMGDIYKRYYDYPKALLAYRKAYARYLNTNRERHQYHALLDIALVCFQLKEFKISELLLRQILSFAFRHSDEILIGYCYGNLILALNEQHLNEEAEKVYDRLLHLKSFLGFGQTGFMASLAYMYAGKMEHKQAELHMKQALKMVQTQKDSIDLYYYKSIIAQKQHRYRDAYGYFVCSAKMQDSLLRSVLQQPILSTQRDFLANKLEYQAYRLRIEQRLRLFYVAVALLIMSGIFGTLYYRLRRKDAMVSRSMAMYDELQQATQHTHSQMEKQIHELFKRQFKLLNELGEAYYAFSAKADNKERIYQKVLSLLKPLSKNDQTFRELEAIIDRYHANAMQHLRTEFPKWKEEDFQLLCYRFAGFSANMISVLTGESINNVYKRISRLRCRIRISDTVHRELYLRLFDK